MVVEEVHGNYGRMVLFTGKQRGGELGGPVCRIMLNTEGPNGVLMELARIDCFLFEPHHHVSVPVFNPAKEYTGMVRVFVSDMGRILTHDEWFEAARRCVKWLREDWTREMKEAGWGEWVIDEAEKEKKALCDAAEAFLMANPPSGKVRDLTPEECANLTARSDHALKMVGYHPA